MIGEIRIFAGNFAPRGWAFSTGQKLKTSEYTSLLSVLGDRYGGDGKTTFALPDLRKIEIPLKGARYIIAVEGIYPSRS